jgi:hypothetical protein
MEENFVQWQLRWYTGIGGRTYTTELTVAFRDYVNAPQNAFQGFVSSIVSSEEPNVITCIVANDQQMRQRASGFY